MTDRPRLFLTNWSSPRLYGTGALLTIMALPRWWERGNGVVAALVPVVADLRAVQREQIDHAEYRRRFDARAEAPGFLDGLRPGVLSADPIGLVSHGDTLCCGCSVAKAAAGRCHRVYAADLLVRAGWDVVLDGRLVVEAGRRDGCLFGS